MAMGAVVGVADGAAAAETAAADTDAAAAAAAAADAAVRSDTPPPSSIALQPQPPLLLHRSDAHRSPPLLPTRPKNSMKGHPRPQRRRSGAAVSCNQQLRRQACLELL